MEPSRLLERLSLASPGVPLTLELAHKEQEHNHHNVQEQPASALVKIC